MGKLYKFLVLLPILLITVVSPFLIELSILTIISSICFYILIYPIVFNLSHRAIAHRHIKLTRLGERVIGFILLFSLRGDPMSYTLSHRYHHRYADTEKDFFGPANGIVKCFTIWAYNVDEIMLKYRSLIKDYPEHDYKFFYFLYEYKVYIIWATLLSVSLVSTDLALGLILASGMTFIAEQISMAFLEHNPIKKKPYNNYLWSWISLSDYHKNHHEQPWTTSNNDPGKFLKPVCKFLKLAE